MDTYESPYSFRTVDPRNVNSTTADLRFLGSGISRKVFALSEREVLKVETNRGFAGGNLDEYNAWQEIEGTEYADCFARVLWCSDDGRLLVAERAAGTAEELGLYRDDRLRAACREFGIGDQHHGNWGAREDGSLLIIDYAMQGRGFRDDSYEDDCHCTMCRHEANGCSNARVSNACVYQCHACDPEGERCNCNTWSGHRRRTCEACEIEDGATFRTKTSLVLARNGCRVDAPAIKVQCRKCAPYRWAQEIEGQGHLALFAMERGEDMDKAFPAAWALLERKRSTFEFHLRPRVAPQAFRPAVPMAHLIG